MALTQYCELDEVRAALGVNHIELPDTVLNLPIYEIGLVRELAKVSASLPSVFQTTADVALADRTEQQQALLDSTRMFSVYACAKQVGIALAALAPKDVSDGKASASRFPDSPYKDVLERLELAYQHARSHLVDTFGTTLGTSVSTRIRPAVILGSKRAYDPVTG